MFEHYDSDDDVYWGPVTLKEKKRDILRTVAQETERRNSIWCDPSFTSNQSKRYEEITSVEDQLYSVNVPSNMSDSQNFIEKVAEVLEITSAPTEETSYFTAKDSAGHSENDTRYKTADTFNTHRTSVTISPDNTNLNHYEASKYRSNDSVDSSICMDDVVDISSDFDDSLSDQKINITDSLTKQETFSEDSIDLDNSMFNHGLNLKDSLIIQTVFSGDSHSDNPKTNLPNNDDVNIINSSEKTNLFMSSEETILPTNHPGKLYNNLDIIEEVDENNTHMDTVPKIEIISSSGQCRDLNDTRVSDCAESSHDESVKFNDTLEEMEKLLSEGLDYTMTSNESNNKLDRSQKNQEVCTISEVTPVKPNKAPIKKYHLTPDTYSRTISKHNIVPSRTPNVSLPTIERTTNKPLSKSQKSPKRTITPIKLLPKDRYKNIQSPVATYIKNSGKAPLLRTVTPSKPNNKENNNHSLGLTLKKVSADNSIRFPEVRYKAAKTKIVETGDFKLPPSISALIPLKANVAHHREKIGRKQLSKELVDGNLTSATDSSLNATQDLSILDKKNAFI